METNSDKSVPDYLRLREAEKREQAINGKAEALENFGTLMSLGASALWFADGIFEKNIPPLINKISLAAVSVGIGSVLYSYKLRHDAKNVALNDDELLTLRSPANADMKSWTDRQNEAPAAVARR